jgi:sialate O-acetylesterase
MSVTPKSVYSLFVSCLPVLSCRAVVIIFLSFSAAGVISAAAIPARIFSDHMVLQQDLPVPVWGMAAAGDSVVVEFAGQSVRTKAADDGRWRVRLEPMKANPGGRVMQISSLTGGDPVVIRDVLVGEVWFSGGQSNMAYTTGQMAGRLAEGRALVEAANMKGIRLRKINERDSPLPKDDLAGGSWEVCSPQSVGRYSAVAFVFARRLHRELGVPVGIIDCSWGGTPIEPYIPADAFTGHPTLEKLAALAKTGDIEAIRRLPGGTFARSPAWLAGAIYNGRIAPVAPYAIRGAIWYQGESNCGRGEDPRQYAHKMRALTRGWRDAWGRRDLPLYFVQLPQWKSYAWTYLREEQRRALDAGHTGMAVTVDLDNAGDIHPPNKIDVGERLARWPLARVYGREVTCSGPLYRGISVRQETIIVDFEHAGTGLMIGRIDGVGKVTPQPAGALNGFELFGEDGAWHPAKGKVKGSSVVVSSPGVQKPVAVRYACHPEAPKERPWNLYNKTGLPASPFCSDWSRMPYDPGKNPMSE